MKNPYYNGPLTDHFDGLRFFNPEVPAADKNLSDILKWKLFGAEKRKGPMTVNAQRNLVPSAEISGLKITHIGHASYLIQAHNLNILVDPLWSERASPLSWIGPKRFNPPAIAFGDLPHIHAVLVTHNHYDHLDNPTLQKLWQKFQPQIFTPLGNDAIMRRFEPSIKASVGDWWSDFSLSPEIGLSIVPAYHWSARGLNDRRMALWGGFILRTARGHIYCAGDTAYRDGVIFKQIRDRFGDPLMALLPIGAYSPRWFMKSQHADPEEAVQIAIDCGTQHMLGIHWGTFSLSDEPMAEPAERLKAAVIGKRLDREKFKAFAPGDVWIT